MFSYEGVSGGLISHCVEFRRGTEWSGAEYITHAMPGDSSKKILLSIVDGGDGGFFCVLVCWMYNSYKCGIA